MKYLLILISILLLTCSNYCPPSIPIEKVILPDYFKSGIVYSDPELKEYVEKSLIAWNIKVKVEINQNEVNNKFHLVKDCSWWNGKTVKNDLYFNIYICQNSKNIQQTISHEIAHAIGLKHGYGTSIIDGCYDVNFPEKESLDLIEY